jgi:hypothetical protein
MNKYLTVNTTFRTSNMRYHSKLKSLKEIKKNIFKIGKFIYLFNSKTDNLYTLETCGFSVL